MTEILVVEDEAGIALGLRNDLRLEGYAVEVVADGETAFARIQEKRFDLILLDIMLPRKDGFSLVRDLRRAGVRTPIILLTARTQESEKVLGLELGADDYVTKPFSISELLARIRAALRRVPVDPGLELQRIKLENVEIDFSSRRVTGPGRDVRLTPKEFDLLSYLSARPNRTLTHRELLRAVWGADYGDEVEYLRVFVNRLRWKIEPDRAEPRFLVTEPWVGYRFCLPK